MRGSQWKGGVCPPGITPTDLYVLGPDDYTNYDFLCRRLDRIVLKEPDLNVHCLEHHGGNKVWNAEKDMYELVGVNCLVQRWAEYHWYTRVIHHPTGKGEAGRAAELLAMIQRAPEGALLASWRRYLRPGGVPPLPGWVTALRAILSRNFRVRIIA